jgi:hypothetical protein
MEIACIKLVVRMTILPVRTREASIWKLLVADVQPFGRQGTTVWTRLILGKNFNEILGQLIAQLSVRTTHDYRLDGAQFLSSQMLI